MDPNQDDKVIDPNFLQTPKEKALTAEKRFYRGPFASQRVAKEYYFRIWKIHKSVLKEKKKIKEKLENKIQRQRAKEKRRREIEEAKEKKRNKKEKEKQNKVNKEDMKVKKKQNETIST